VLAGGIAVLAALMAVLLIFVPPRRVLLVPAVLFPLAAGLLLASFGAQLADISRQAVQLAVADTSGDLVKADQLGIPFEQLVGMQDYLRQQVSSNPAIGQIELSGPSGVAYAAGGDDLGTAATEMLTDSVLSFLVSALAVEQTEQTGVRLSATVNIVPIMRDLAAPLLVVLVLWIGCGAALWVSFVDRIGSKARLPSALVPPALFFFLLFLVFGGLLPTSALTRHWQVWLVVVSATLGFLLPPRLAVAGYIASLVLAALGFLSDSGLLLAGAGLGCGVGLANLQIILKPFHLAASLVPSIGLLCLRLFDLLPGVLPGKVMVAILLLLLAPVFARRDYQASAVSQPETAGSRAGLFAGIWIWLCLFAMQVAGHLLLVIAALGVDSALPGQYSQVEYLFLMVLLFLVGNQLAGWFGHASGLRWILCEFAMLGVVLLTVWSYVAGGHLYVNAAITAVLFGTIVRWTNTLPFVVSPGRISGSLASGVALFAFAVALATALSLASPGSAALPAILLFLAAFSPLAFAKIAGIGPQTGQISAGMARNES
jgi:hypothetical protein